MSQSLAEFSHSLIRMARAAAPSICAIRVAPNRHISGLICQGDTIVTIDQALPALDSFTVVLPGKRVAAARPAEREPASNLAMLRLESPWAVGETELTTPTPGLMAIVVGADADASPTVRLTVVHRLIQAANGMTPVLDLSPDHLEPGCLVLDALGRLIGLSAVGPNGQPVAIPGGLVAAMLKSGQAAAVTQPAYPATTVNTPPAVAPVHGGPVAISGSDRRGWLGVSLQPITVPDYLVARAGQTSGRMVVSVTRGGPADAAGLRPGDVVLALNGTSASGPHALRDFLTPDRIGTSVEVRFLRDGSIGTTHLTVATQPG